MLGTRSSFLIAVSLLMIGCRTESVSERPGQPSVDLALPPRVEPSEAARAPAGRVEPRSCEEQEKEINYVVTAFSRVCEEDFNCVKLNLGCPFGCNQTISDLSESTAAIAHIRELNRRYDRECNRCEYKCRHLEFGCVNGLCQTVDVKPTN